MSLITSRYFGCHNHTEFSNCHVIDSINKADQMIEYAWELGMSGIAFTDHDCLSGAIKFFKAYQAKLEKEWKEAKGDLPFPGYEEASKELDFTVALGNEIYLSEDDTTQENYKDRHFYHYILIAKDSEGFKQIRQVSSEAWKRGWSNSIIMRTPTYSTDLLKYIKGGHVICSTACLAGVPARIVIEMRDTEDEAAKTALKQRLDHHLAAMQGLFGKDNFYIELQPNGREDDQNYYNRYMLEHYWGKYPFIFTTDSHYLKADLRQVHANFLNSRSSKNRDVDEFYQYAYMMSAEEVKSYMPYVTDDQFNMMVENTRKIKGMCHYYDLKQKQVIVHVEYEHEKEYEPDLDIFEDVDEETYPNFYYYLHTTDKADHYLAELIAHGFVENFEPKWDIPTYYARLEEELWTIKSVGEKIQQHMSDYFISMAKMIEIMWDAGSIVGPSRGSAGVMLINYLTGITQMNPVEMDLPYVWRFMHPSRPDLPDIDVDTESDKRAKVFLEVQKYFRSIGGEVINICTFGTEGTKGAIATAGRGLGIDLDVINYLTSLVPNERGFDWSLKDCYCGNNEDRKPIKAFVDTMNSYPMLWEVAQNIEGLVTHLGVHASGVVCLNDDFTNYGSYMKTNNGQLVSAYDLHDQEFTGLVKYDFLTVSALDRIHQCMNYMLEDKVIEWQGSLKKTYDKYLAPKVLDYDSPEMWDMVSAGSISSLFQFDTLMGTQGINAVKPHSLTELAITNALMRLMTGSGDELPMDKYAKFKTAIVLWYNEMASYHLNQDEVKVLEKYLLPRCGLADTQEIIMQLSMEPHISNFSMEQANKLRKTIAKKNFRDIEGVKALFYQKGEEAGTRKEMLDYVWNVQVSMSLGYSFSSIHTTGYSLIAIQEMNLAYHYPILYWNAACLSIDSSAVSQEDFDSLIDEGVLDVTEVEGKKVVNKTNYGKMATALDKFKKICSIELPDINRSRLGFRPDIKNNNILYGLKGISTITEPVINEIMQYRPFSSLDDFLSKVTKKTVTKNKVINLIKCGAFNKVENASTKEILHKYIDSICDKKKRLTMQNANALIDAGLIPDEYMDCCDAYKLTKELRRHRDAKKLWYFGDCLDIPNDKVTAWKSLVAQSGIAPEEVYDDNHEVHKALNSDEWDSFYEKYKKKLGAYVKENEVALLDKLNQKAFDDEWNKYCSGDNRKWELDSLNFFFSGHPLTTVLPQIPDVAITPLRNLVEGRQDGSFFIKGKVIPKMYLYTIAGTVIDKDKTKGLVTIQCPDGVVAIKIYKDLFATYNAAISSEDEDIEQDSFFEKGTHLLVTGIKRGETFVPKVYKNTGRKAIERINLDANGNFAGLESKLDVPAGGAK